MSDIKKRRRLRADQKWQIYQECQQSLNVKEKIEH